MIVVTHDAQLFDAPFSQSLNGVPTCVKCILLLLGSLDGEKKLAKRDKEVNTGHTTQKLLHLYLRGQ